MNLSPQALLRSAGRVLTLRRLALGAVVTASVTFGAHRLAACSGPVPLQNLEFPTLGGEQLWADVRWDSGWRVQSHVWTGHSRLLNPDDVRMAWGSTRACAGALEALRGDDAPGPLATAAPARVCVLLHGLWRTRDSMGLIKGGLEAEGFTVVDFGYPSTRRTIADHSAQLAELLDNLPWEGTEISFVTHSLGALVVRDLLAREGDFWRRSHSLGRAVFIAAPQKTPALATFASKVPGAFAIYGKPSAEMAAGKGAELGQPPLPFMGIAASRGTEEGWNPLIPGDDDGVVAVSETMLPGEVERLVVRGTHTFVMRDEAVIGAVARFLKAEAPKVGDGSSL